MDLCIPCDSAVIWYPMLIPKAAAQVFHLCTLEHHPIAISFPSFFIKSLEYKRNRLNISGRTVVHRARQNEAHVRLIPPGIQQMLRQMPGVPLPGLRDLFQTFLISRIMLDCAH